MVRLLFLLDDLPVVYSFSIIHGPSNFHQSHCYTEKNVIHNIIISQINIIFAHKNKTYGLK